MVEDTLEVVSGESVLVAANDNNKYRFYVYAWCYPDGRPFYVGKGCGRRDAQPKSNKLFRNIVAKIGRDGGSPRVVRWHEGAIEEDAHRLEMAYIKLFGRRDLGTGVLVNMTDGGEGASGLVHSNETRTKMRAAASGGNNPNFGKTLSAEIRAKMSEAQRKRYEDPAERAKISEAQRGENNPNFGKERSAETRAKQSEGHRLAGPRRGRLKGVSFDKSHGRWRANITIDGKQRHLGRFPTPEEAALVYDKEAAEAWGPGNCYLNSLDALTNL